MSNEKIEDHYNSVSEQKLDVDGLDISYREYSPDNSPQVTLLCVTGGPGVPKQHMAPLSLLSEEGFRVVLYDQHNIGQSDDSDYPYDMIKFKKEITAFTEKYENVILVGHSWGSMLSLEYATTKEDNISGMVCVAPLFDTQQNIAIAKSKREELLETETLKQVIGMEAEGNFDNEVYEDTTEKFNEVRTFKPPVPDLVQDVSDNVNQEMYENMWGPEEFVLSENAVLKDWSVKDDLSQITTQTLLITGKDDSFGIHDLFEAKHKMAGDVTVEILKEASHTPFWEEREEFTEKLLEWLENIDSG